MSKYFSKRMTIFGITFDSKKEAKRYTELKVMENAGKISGLELQKKFVLIPSQYVVVDGKRKCAERQCSYVADFCYYDNEKQANIVEDVKGMKTEVYKIKKKLMLYLLGIQIHEI